MEVPYGWRRNGSVAVEHGGVYPQGFYPCSDGYVALVARSRQDWYSILHALGDPPWASEERFANPFKLSVDDREVTPLLVAELAQYTRKQLLERALETGATMAPVLEAAEAANWEIFGTGFSEAEGRLNLPFTSTDGSG